MAERFHYLKTHKERDHRKQQSLLIIEFLAPCNFSDFITREANNTWWSVKRHRILFPLIPASIGCIFYVGYLK